MRHKFETLGNAILQIFEDEKPILATDPWLGGTAYFGSWALDHDLSHEQIENVHKSPFIWISHGHPDHFHWASIRSLSRDRQILLPNHYYPEIKDFLGSKGFCVRVLRFKEWMQLTPSIRVMCLENENQDAMLVVEAGDALIIDLNDSPTYGEERFLRRLVSKYDKTYLLSSCSVDGDMINFVDENGRPLARPPHGELKAGAIIQLSDLCTSHLKVRYFCCFSSQHLYVRADSKWATPYRIGWTDMKTNWNSTTTQLIEPFVTIDLSDCSVRRNHPTQQPDMSRVSESTGEDDWNEMMSEADWQALGNFIYKFKLLETRMDFIQFTVAGERRRYYLKRTGRRIGLGKQKGINFFAPKHSLMKTVEYGYFDDILLGNFMKTQLINMTLYPNFTPYISKFGGNAKVYTASQLVRCQVHYFWLSPRAYLTHKRRRWVYHWKPVFRMLFGILDTIKAVGRRMRGLPPLPKTLG